MDLNISTLLSNSMAIQWRFLQTSRQIADRQVHDEREWDLYKTSNYKTSRTLKHVIDGYGTWDRWQLRSYIDQIQNCNALAGAGQCGSKSYRLAR